MSSKQAKGRKQFASANKTKDENSENIIAKPKNSRASTSKKAVEKKPISNASSKKKVPELKLSFFEAIKNAANSPAASFANVVAQYFEMHSSKKSEFSFENVVAKASDDVLGKMFEIMLKHIKEVQQQPINENDDFEDDDVAGSEDDPSSVPKEKGTKSQGKKARKVESVSAHISKKKVSNPRVQFLHSAALLARSVIKDKERNPPHLLAILQTLHNSMFDYLKYDDYVCDLARVCHSYWEQERPSRASLVAFSFWAFLIKATAKETTSPAPWVKLIYKYRDALSCIDFSDPSPSTEALETSLLSCLITKAFLTEEKGVAFLSRLFLIETHPDFIPVLCCAVKNKIARKPEYAAVYGEVFWKAWSASSASHRRNIEEFLQTVLETASAGSDTIAPACRAMMEPFFKTKKTKGVDELLYRLTSPFLWRYLRCPNPTVRKNALYLLTSVFPLQDPEGTKESADRYLLEQTRVFEEHFYDECPEVRIVAITGACRILSGYWEFLPEQTIRNLIARLINDLSHDKASTLVRISVIEGMSFILDNHLSHSCLKALLPRLSTLFHDNNEVVRVKFIHLLQKIKGIKGIRYFDVIPIDQLLARMSQEEGKVKKALTDLLLSAYFPHEKPASEQVQRCFLLIKASPEAAVQFYGEMPHQNLIPKVATLVRYLIKYLSKKISSTELQTSKEAIEEKENSDDDCEEITRTDMECCVSVVLAMWKGLAELTSKEASNGLKLLAASFTDSQFVPLFKFFENSRALAPLLRIVRYVPATGLPQLCQLCTTHLRKCPRDAVAPLVEALFAWDLGAHVLKFAIRTLSLPFKEQTDEESSTNKKRSRNDNANTEERDTPQRLSEKLLYVLLLVNAVLASEFCRKEFLENHAQLSQTLFLYLQQYFSLTESEIQERESDLSYSVLLEAVSLWCRLFVHVEGDHPEKDAEFLVDVIGWLDTKLFPLLIRAPTDKRRKSLENPDLISFRIDVANVLLKVLTECFALGFLSKKLSSVLIDNTKKVSTNQNPEVQEKILERYTRMLLIDNGLENNYHVVGTDKVQEGEEDD